MRRRTATLALMLATGLGVAGCSIPRWPVDGTLTSPFGLRFRGWSPDLHRGVDIAVPAGTPVRSMAPGRIHFAGAMGGYGNVVWVDHGGDVLTVYAHLSEIRVREGERIGSGDVVGLSGSSGNAVGPHLHFELWRWGRQVDPVPLLGGFP